jgi:hypothetical protein
MILNNSSDYCLEKHNRFLKHPVVRAKHLPTVGLEEVYLSVRYLVQTSCVCRQMAERQAARRMKMQFRFPAYHT